MYTLSSWKSHLGSVRVDFLNQKPVRTVKDPFTAYIPEEVTQVSRMADVHSKFLKKSPRYRESRPFAPGTRLNHRGPIYSLCPWRSHPGIEDDRFTL